jgi:hypothetical protein
MTGKSGAWQEHDHGMGSGREPRFRFGGVMKSQTRKWIVVAAIVAIVIGLLLLGRANLVGPRWVRIICAFENAS